MADVVKYGDEVVIGLTRHEAMQLMTILNSGDIVDGRFYSRVPLVSELVDTLYDGEAFGTMRREFYEKYGFGRVEKSGFSFKEPWNEDGRPDLPDENDRPPF